MSDEGASSAYIEGSSGVQTGSWNTQVNISSGVGESPLDPETIPALDPYTVADLFRRHALDAVVRCIVRCAPEGIGDALKMLLATDEAKVIAILGELSRGRAELLLTVLVQAAPWAKLLPEAAEEINHEAVALGWSGRDRLKRLGVQQDLVLFRDFTEGAIVWSARGETRMVRGAIRDRYLAKPDLEDPADNESDAPPSTTFPLGPETAMVSQSGADGAFQVFVNYHDNARRTTWCRWGSPERVVAIQWEAWEYYHSMGAAGSWLGFPVGPREAGTQPFQGGVLRWIESGGLVAVPGEVEEMLRQPDGRSKLGAPTSEELSIGEGLDRVQFFEVGGVVLRDGRRRSFRWEDIDAAALVQAGTEVAAQDPPPGEERQERPRGELRGLLGAGRLLPGDRLIHTQTHRKRPFSARVTADGYVRLEDGQESRSPSRALEEYVGKRIDGWTNWVVERTGQSLAELRDNG
jgi:Restriction Enzyme Adenine Methylase Associated/LGFP repeat